MHAHFVSSFSTTPCARERFPARAGDSGHAGEAEDAVGGRLGVATSAQGCGAARKQRALGVELEIAPNVAVFAHHVAVARAVVGELGQQCAVGEHGVADQRREARACCFAHAHVDQLFGLVAARDEGGGAHGR